MQAKQQQQKQHEHEHEKALPMDEAEPNILTELDPEIVPAEVEPMPLDEAMKYR
jgi:hypothetical protein